jgi:hypothetical protein
MRIHEKHVVTASGVTSRVLGGLTHGCSSRAACLRPGARFLQTGFEFYDLGRNSFARAAWGWRGASPGAVRAKRAPRLVIGTLNVSKDRRGLQLHRGF